MGVHFVVPKLAPLCARPISKPGIGETGVGGIELWRAQLYRLLVLWPAWLLTPAGRKVLFSRSTLWRIALAAAFFVAIMALAQSVPADMAFIGAGDVVAYLEVAAIVWVTGAMGWVRAGVKLVRRSAGGLVAARRERRAAMRRRRQRRPPPPANDDGLPDGRWTVAA
jgi:hypothetical protein